MSKYPPADDTYPPLGLLAQAGFEQGDFLPLYTFNPNNAVYASFTSTTYTYDNNLSFLRCRWDKFFPPGSTSAVFGQIQQEPGADESVSVRIYNSTDGEVIGEVTGLTTEKVVTIEATEYTPTTTDSEIFIRWNFKTDPGVNTSYVRLPCITFGVII